ncbi:MAG: hypothetical protein JWO02_110 [Solirubrobacterales bacterium]|nr:hypothetical protein [Solirubrobacterales bacterium]
MTITRRLAVLAVVPCVAVALMGCTKTIKEQDLESKVAQNLERQYTGMRVTVDCPKGKEAKKGNAFTCRAVIGGSAAVVDIGVLDGTGRVSARIHSAASAQP